MLDKQLDGLIYGTGANLQYFTGSKVAWKREHEPAEPDCLFVLPREEEPYIIALGESSGLTETRIPVQRVASFSEAASLLKGSLSGYSFGTNRQAEPFLTSLITSAIPNAICVNADNLGEEIRLVKDNDEIAKIRLAAALTDKVMEEIIGFIRPGITQLELQYRIRQAGLRLGAQDVSFPPAALFVKSGTEPTIDPFVYPMEEGLVAGTSVAFDFGFVLNGYCSDFGRSFYCGPAPSDFSMAYKALQDAQIHLISNMKPGLRIGDVPSILINKLDELGYGDRLRARLPDGTLGHQIGVDLHENPWIKPDCATLLCPGMVMCIEPKVWLPGGYYLRVEDMVLITETGAESLTKFDRRLFDLPL